MNGSRTHAWLYGTACCPWWSTMAPAPCARSTSTRPAQHRLVDLWRHGYRVMSDLRGSPRLVVDAGGTVVKQLDSDNFGNVILDSNAAFDLLGFAGGREPAHPLIRFGGATTCRDRALDRRGPGPVSAARTCTPTWAMTRSTTATGGPADRGHLSCQCQQQERVCLPPRPGGSPVQDHYPTQADHREPASKWWDEQNEKCSSKAAQSDEE